MRARKPAILLAAAALTSTTTLTSTTALAATAAPAGAAGPCGSGYTRVGIYNIGIEKYGYRTGILGVEEHRNGNRR
ncbi:hypothetical protein ACFYUV_48780 [Nonomuraea sp. NPDC003560]|uniref:hypothetical protein n=1 Tax=Nonomuraea sp. NPDC003560 TaxID=3364341 RepID=UPI00367BB8B2